MRHRLLLTSALILLAISTVAQPNTQSPNAQQTTVQGCLTGALHDYDLVDANQIVFRVIGNNKLLSQYIGQQVELTGTLEERIPPPTELTESSWTEPQHRFNVSSIKKLSDTCTGASE